MYVTISILLVSTDTDGGGYEWYMYEVLNLVRTKFSSCLQLYQQGSTAVVCYTKFSTKFNLLTCYGPLHYIYLFLVMRTIAEF